MSSGRRLFDSHFHVIDHRFPLVANQGYTPPPFSLADYRAAANPLGIQGGAVVSGSFQAFDQSYLLAAPAAGLSGVPLELLLAAGLGAICGGWVGGRFSPLVGERARAALVSFGAAAATLVALVRLASERARAGAL